MGWEVGTIERGKLVEIIVVRRTPLFDILAFANEQVVVEGGIVYKDLAGRVSRTDDKPTTKPVRRKIPAVVALRSLTHGS